MTSVFGVPPLVPLFEMRLQSEQAGAEEWGGYRNNAEYQQIHRAPPLRIAASKVNLSYTSACAHESKIAHLLCSDFGSS
jgi:hypothetical protein